jgi:hypothetical protein
MLKPTKAIISDADADLDARSAAMAAKISAAYRRSPESLVEAGRLLIESKEGPNKLPHGRWLQMVHEKLPFGPRTAQRLMRIARHRALNATDLSHLPSSLVALDALCSLPDAEFEQCMADEAINPDMTEEDAKRLKRKEVIDEPEPLPDPPYEPEHRRDLWNYVLRRTWCSILESVASWRSDFEDWENIEIEPDVLKSLQENFAAIAPLLEKAGWQRVGKGGPSKRALDAKLAAAASRATSRAACRASTDRDYDH